MKRIRILLIASLFLAAAALAGRPVAQWDVVPHQRISGTFAAGVCAFHRHVVTVEFRVNGQVVHTAKEPTLNERTGVWEYVFPIDTTRYPDGPLDVEARAIPSTAEDPSHDLPALRLYANSGGTLDVERVLWVDAQQGDDQADGTQDRPLKTLKVAVSRTPPGGTVRLLPGRYSSDGLAGGNQRPYWTTIEAAPGIGVDEVMVGPGRPGTQRLRWRNLTLYCDSDGGYSPILSGENGRHEVWVDGCTARNLKGRWGGDSRTFGNRYAAYVTGGLTTEMSNGPGARLIRDHEIRTITSDAWSGGGRLVVNSVCHDIDPGTTGAHPDFHQSYRKAPDFVQNVILYNVKGYRCRSQGLFGSRLRHAAFVNVLFEKHHTHMLSQYSGPMENVLFFHLNIVGQSWLWRDGYTPSDVHVVNGIFSSMDAMPKASLDGLTITNNHFANPKRAMGQEQTTGNPQYVDGANDDYAVKEGSPAAGGGLHLPTVPADIEGRPYRVEDRARGCYARTREP